MKRRDAVRLGFAGVLAACVPVDRLLEPAEGGLLGVQGHGATGDGQTDDTAAFRAAIKALPPEGGTLHVPAGRYLIDPARGVKLRSGLHLDMASGAVLVGMPSQPRGTALLEGVSLDDVKITGGRLSGSAGGATPSQGSVASFGLVLRGCTNVTVTGLHASGFDVDGIYVGAAQDGGWRPSENVTLDGCVMENCRRQGVSVTSCTGFYMIGCEGRSIGPDLPGSGVDLEPNPDRKILDAEVRGCSFHDNSGFGIMVGGAGGENLVLADNDISACVRGGILVKSSHNVQVSDNRITGCEPAISVRGRTSGVRLEQNICTAGNIEVRRPATAELIGNRCGLSDADLPRP